MSAHEWTRAEVKPWVAENERGGSWHATFTCGTKSVTFIVVAMKQDPINPGSGPYTFADWTTPNGDSDRQYGDAHAARVDGLFCSGVVIEMLGEGLRDGTVSHVSPRERRVSVWAERARVLIATLVVFPVCAIYSVVGWAGDS